jgi:hypothetical protein
VEHVKLVHTNGGRDVLLGLGYMGLFGSNISMGFFVPLGNPMGRVSYPYPCPSIEFYTCTLTSE